MKGAIRALMLLAAVMGCQYQPAEDSAAVAEDGLKVFISVDMEGIAGVITGNEVSSSGSEYQYFRELTTMEASAAVEGALAAGATEVVVRDGHGAKNNIIPHLLHREAKLLRGVTDRPENMMLGLDETFDAVIFIGYHAKAGTEEGILAHTSSGNVIDLSVNGVSFPEAGYNAVIAGLHDVPVALVAGDNWICEQVTDLFGEVVTVETKVGMNVAALGLHPEVVREMIRDSTEAALRDLSRFEPYRMEPPYTMVLKVRREGELYPGAEKTGEGEFTFTSTDFLEVMNAFNAMK
ncbi:MAG: M55 family metallopeptidase [Gemmatimonadetes bacterium]|nr:M55 family metallopeptidase [Gemmatimonadota bacterium]